MKGKRPFTDEEARQVLAVADARERVLLLLGLTYCTRIGEAVRLTVGDVSGRYVTIAAEKRGDIQTYPLTTPVRLSVDALVAAYRQAGKRILPTTPLFLSQKGEQQAITPRHAARLFQRACQRAGITDRIGTHSARKTALLRIFEMTGLNLIETRRYSRHLSIASLQPYLESAQENSRVHDLVWD